MDWIWNIKEKEELRDVAGSHYYWMAGRGMGLGGEWKGNGEFRSFLGLLIQGS